MALGVWYSPASFLVGSRSKESPCLHNGPQFIEDFHTLEPFFDDDFDIGWHSEREFWRPLKKKFFIFFWCLSFKVCRSSIWWRRCIWWFPWGSTFRTFCCLSFSDTVEQFCTSFSWSWVMIWKVEGFSFPVWVISLSSMKYYHFFALLCF